MALVVGGILGSTPASAAQGPVYIADSGNNRVIKVTPDGAMTVVGATVSNPTGVAADGAGNLFIVDDGNHRALKLTPRGVQTTVASNLNNPYGVAVDGSSDAFIADTGNNHLLKVTPGGTQTMLGSGLSFPAGPAVDGSGDVFIADSGNNRVLKVAPDGSQSTVGSGLHLPNAVAVDESGDVFIADTANNRVVKVAPDGTQTTVSTDSLNQPLGVAVDVAGDVLIADTGNNRVVQVAPNGTETTIGSDLNRPAAVASGLAPATTFSRSGLTFGSAASPQPMDTVSPSQRVTVTNSGADTLAINGFVFAGTNPDDFFVSNDTCRLPLAPGASCTVNVRFAPQGSGQRSGTLALDGNSLNTPTIALQGYAGTLPRGATGSTGATGPAGPAGKTGRTGKPGPRSERFVICRRYPHLRGKPVLCTVSYLRHKKTAVAGGLSRDGRRYANGIARNGTALSLKAIRHMREGHYRLTLTYNHRDTYVQTVRVLIIR